VLQGAHHRHRRALREQGKAMHTAHTLQVVDRPGAGTNVSDLLGAMARAQATSARQLAHRTCTDSQVEFLAFVAHELRCPLAPIRTAAALITRGTPEDLLRAQRVIDRQVDHLARMIDDLLDLARGGTGKLTLVRSQVDLADVIEQALIVCRPTLSRRRQRVEQSGDALAVTLRADGLRLIQIVINLVDNASKFSGDGATVTLSVRSLPGCIELAIADEGMGMDAATLASAFEPFAQAAHVAGFNRSGLGIGLALVRQLADSHGGHVVAESAGVGRGSRFVLTLPAMSEVGNAPATTASPSMDSAAQTSRAGAGDAHPADSVASPCFSGERR
jgi:signal transduction histidine kinase